MGPIYILIHMLAHSAHKHLPIIMLVAHPIHLHKQLVHPKLVYLDLDPLLLAT